jgi:hypothetical protein
MPHGKNEVLVTALKKILAASRAGNVDDAYRGYASLFASDEFAGFSPDDQRQTFKLMLQAKPPSPKSDAVVAALKAGLARLEKLAASHENASDYELLGVANAAFGDVPAARAAYETALVLERARDPSSELVRRLEQRVKPS